MKAQLLIRDRRGVNDRDSKRKTPLIWASIKGNLFIRELLIEWGANSDISDASNRNADDYWNDYIRGARARAVCGVACGGPNAGGNINNGGYFNEQQLLCQAAWAGFSSCPKES